MKNACLSLTVAVTLALAVSVSAQNAGDQKHPKDPCPEGTREVVIHRTTSSSGSGSVSAGANIGAANGSLGGSLLKSTTTTETSKVCRPLSLKK